MVQWYHDTTNTFYTQLRRSHLLSLESCTAYVTSPDRLLVLATPSTDPVIFNLELRGADIERGFVRPAIWDLLPGYCILEYSGQSRIGHLQACNSTVHAFNPRALSTPRRFFAGLLCYGWVIFNLISFPLHMQVRATNFGRSSTVRRGR
jgi:hypothetical protein